MISLALLLIFGLVIVSAWATRHAIGGGQRFSDGFRGFILALAGFPTQAKSVIGLVNNNFPPKGAQDLYFDHVPSSGGTSRISGFILVSCIAGNGENELRLIDLSTGLDRKLQFDNKFPNNVQYSDSLIGSESRRQSALSSRKRVWHPYLNKNGSVVYNIPWNDLISFNLKTRTEEWRIRGAFHHSIEPDSNGDFWVCGAASPGAIIKPDQKSKHANNVFEDQILVHVSKKGKILKALSVADLLITAGLEYLLYGVSNPSVNFDPIHLNQITPITNDMGVFRKGQVLVSLRNISTILLVDPTVDQIVWHRCGPWMNQHCVIPIGESTFSVLDNHSFASGEYWLLNEWKTKVVKHNVESGKSVEVNFNSKTPIDFRIPIEGRAVLVSPETWMIEDCLHGTVMVFKNGELAFKWTNRYTDGTVGITSWCRYLTQIEIANEF